MAPLKITWSKWTHRWRDRWRVLREGMVGEFAFMRVDVVGHSKLTRENPSSIIAEVLDALEQHVEALSRERGGRIWSWAGDGGLIAFYIGSKTEKVGDAIAVANQLLGSLPDFSRQHPIADGNLSLRVAVHCGTARFRSNTGRIHSSAINLVAHLEHQRTHPDSISITHDVFRELHHDDRSRFVPAGQIEGTAIYTSDSLRGALFPKRGEEWRQISDALTALVDQLRPLASNAVLLGFSRTSAVMAGMLAPNLEIKPVVVLGRDYVDEPLEKHSPACGELAKSGRDVIIVSFAIANAETTLRKVDFVAACGVKKITVAALFITPNAALRLERRDVSVVYGDKRDIGDRMYDELPWVLGATYDHI